MGELEAAVAGLLVAQRGLEQRSVGEILAVLDRVVARWLDPADAIRREAEERLGESTGLAPAMLRRGLDQMLCRVQGIGPLLDEDLGDRQALDRFVTRNGGMRSRAYGPRLLYAIFSGNVPGIPAFDMAMALALKSACLVRTASEEPHFAPLFARSVAEVAPGLGAALHVGHWGYDLATPYSQADAVLAYGSDQAIGAIRQKVPDGVRFLGHGHKISFAIIAREAATEESAARLALDVAMYDQQGCVSPHMAFVERGGALAPADFARACGEALAGLQAAMPRAQLTMAEAAALRAVRDEAEFAADALFASPSDLSWAVVHSEAAQFLPSPLNRLVRTFGIDDLAEAVAQVAPHGAYLQTVAFAGTDERRLELAASLGHLGASRICPLGKAQEPDALWRHDGRPTAGDLVRWIDVEP